MPRSFADIAASNAPLDPARAGVRAPRTHILDLETTGLLRGFRDRMRNDIGISQIALREEGLSGASWSRFTDILVDPLTKVREGKLKAESLADVLEAGDPLGRKWQKGFKQKGNVLQGVFERHAKATHEYLDATRGSMKNHMDALVSEAQIVQKMTEHLEAGDRIKGWNVFYDLDVLSQAAARSSEAVNQRWIRALNIARNAGNVVEMSTGVKKFMFLAAQESMMQQKIGREPFFQIKNVSYEVWQAAKEGKLTVDHVDALSADKLLETHKGWKSFLGDRVASGKRPVSFEGYQRWMRMLDLWGNKAQTFATGQRYPNIEFAKGWSAAVISETLQPGVLDRVGGIKGTTLGKQAEKYLAAAGRSMQHEATLDTVLEEMFEKLFETRSKTWGGMWNEIAPRLEPYYFEGQVDFFHRMESAVEKVSRSQVREVAMASSRQLDTTLAGAVGKKVQALGAAAGPLKDAAAHQPWTLREIYSKAGKEVSGAWRDFGRAHPTLRAIAAGAAAFAIADAMFMPEKNFIQGVRDRWSENRRQEGIRHGPMGRGVSSALTDYGSGRDPWNRLTKKILDVVKHRASLSVRSLERDSIYTKAQVNSELWTRVRAAGEVKGLLRPAAAPPVKPGSVGNRAFALDMASRQTSDIYASPVKPKSVRTLWALPTPAAQHSEIMTRVEHGDWGQYGEVSQEKLREMVQSLRQVSDPRAVPGGRNVSTLIDRDLSRALQMERATRNPKLAKEAERVAAEVASLVHLSDRAMTHDQVVTAAGWSYQRLVETGRRANKELAVSTAPGVPKGKAPRFIPDAFPDLYQTGTANRATIMAAFNERVKQAGFMPGLRNPASLWNRAGFGINPSRMPFSNVSQFSSGRTDPPVRFPYDIQSRRNLFEWSKKMALAGPSDLLQAVNRSGVPTNEGVATIDPFAHMTSEYVRYPRNSSLAQALDPKRGLQQGFTSRLQEPVKRVVRISRYFKTQGLESEIFDIIAAGRSEGTRELVEWGKSAGVDMNKSILADAWGRVTDQEITQLASQKQAEGISRKAARRQETLLEKSANRLEKIEAQKRILHQVHSPTGAMRAPAYVSRHQMGMAFTAPADFMRQPSGAHPPLPSNTLPIVQLPPHSESAIKESNKASQEYWAARGMKRSSAKGMEAWKQMGLGMLAIGAAALGAWWLMKDEQDRTSYTMSSSPAYRHPNEFQAMKGHGEFYSSYSEYGWATHQMESQEALAGMRRKQAGVAMIGAMGLQGITHTDTGLLHAWSHFSRKAEIEESRWALQEFDSILKDRGYTAFERREWFRRQKTAKGFVGRIQNVGKPGFFGKTWDGISSYLLKPEAKISGKAAKSAEGFNDSLKRFYDSWVIKPFARKYGKTVNEYRDLKKKGQLHKLAKMRHYSRWSEEASAFKYLWKNLVKDVNSFGAKIQGVGQIWHGAGNLEQLKMAHEAGLIGRLPADLKGPQNMFTKIGRWVSKNIEKGTFATKHPDVHKTLSKFAKGLGKFGRSGLGRAVAKVPVANIAFGIVDGISEMDQYQSAAKGFLVESAAGTVNTAIQFAFFRPTLWVTLGAAIGSVLPGAGTALGAAIGTVVGTAVTAAASLFLGHVLGTAAGGVVRSVGQTVLNARKKHHLDPAAYMPESQVYDQGGGISGMRASGPSSFNRFHAIDAGRPELTPFGGPFNPQKGTSIDMGTLRNANRRRRSLDRRPTMVGQSGFAPTFGLVNNVLWFGRNRSRVRSTVQRGAMSRPNRPRLPANGSRVLRAA